MPSTQIKLFIAFAILGLIVCAQAQDYDDEGGNSNDGYGGFSGGGGGGDDDYAAPRERGIVGAEGSDMNPGYHHQGDEAGNENYDNEDVAAAASHGRPHLVKLIRASRK